MVQKPVRVFSQFRVLAGSSLSRDVVSAAKNDSVEMVRSFYWWVRPPVADATSNNPGGDNSSAVKLRVE